MVMGRSAPAKVNGGRAHWWCCREQDSDRGRFVNGRASPGLLRARTIAFGAVDKACAEAGAEELLPSKVEHHRAHEPTSMTMMDGVRDVVDSGREAVFHCRAGVPRAALIWDASLDAPIGYRVPRGPGRVKVVRATGLDDPIVSKGLKNGSRTEDRREYWPCWEKRVTSGRVHMRFRSSLPYVPHQMSRSTRVRRRERSAPSAVRCAGAIRSALGDRC